MTSPETLAFIQAALPWLWHAVLFGLVTLVVAWALASTRSDP